MDIEYLVSKIGDSWKASIPDIDSFAGRIVSTMNELDARDGCFMEQLEDIPSSWSGYRQSLNFGITAHTELSVICSLKIEDEPLIYHESDLDEYKCNMILGLLATELCNSLICIRNLIDRGFDSQAKTQFRWFVEFSELLCALLIDRSILESYAIVDKSYDEAKKLWHSVYNPKKVRKIINGYEGQVFEDDPISQRFAAHRDAMYTWLSQFSHANFEAQFLTGFAENLTKEECGFTLWGMRTRGCFKTLEYVNLYTFLHILRMRYLLVNEHGWNNLSQGDERTGWIVLCELCKDSYLNTIMEGPVTIFPKG